MGVCDAKDAATQETHGTQETGVAAHGTQGANGQATSTSINSSMINNLQSDEGMLSIAKTSRATKVVLKEGEHRLATMQV